MHKTMIALCAVGIALAAAGPAPAATGNVRLAWNSCAAGPLDLTVAAGQASGIQLAATVSGQSDPTRLYQVQVVYGDAHNLVPDAWRFDPSGCQTLASVTLRDRAAGTLANTCPAFQDAGGVNASVNIMDLSPVPPALPLPPTMMRITVAVSYPNGNAPSAAQTYLLMSADFNEALGVVGPTTQDGRCGGLADGVCFSLISASYLRPDDSTEVPFAVAPGGGMLTANAPGGGCIATPAHPATWGAIKSQYRN